MCIIHKSTFPTRGEKSPIVLTIDYITGAGICTISNDTRIARFKIFATEVDKLHGNSYEIPAARSRSQAGDFGLGLCTCIVHFCSVFCCVSKQDRFLCTLIFMYSVEMGF